MSSREQNKNLTPLLPVHPDLRISMAAFMSRLKTAIAALREISFKFFFPIFFLSQPQSLSISSLSVEWQVRIGLAESNPVQFDNLAWEVSAEEQRRVRTPKNFAFLVFGEIRSANAFPLKKLFGWKINLDSRGGGGAHFFWTHPDCRTQVQTVSSSEPSLKLIKSVNFVSPNNKISTLNLIKIQFP